jgi:hypothetical protein
MEVCEGECLALGGDLHANVYTVESVYIEVYIDLRGAENDVFCRGYLFRYTAV